MNVNVCSWLLTAFVIIFQYMAKEPVNDILNEIRNSVGLYAKCKLYGILIKREGINYEINGTTVRDYLRALYQQAGSLRFWMAVRYCSSLLNHTVDSISPFITGVLVKGKQVLTKSGSRNPDEFN